MRPPDLQRAAARGLGSAGGDESSLAAELNPEITRRCPHACATCEGGITPWTEKRREALRWAVTGRRIIDLPDDAREVARV